MLAKGMDRKYGITGLGEVEWVLGMLVKRDHATRTVCISQEAFTNTVLSRFNLVDAAPVSMPLAAGSFLSTSDCLVTQEEKDDMAGKPYRELVGALSWLALGSRPDIAFAMSTLSRFGHNPGRETGKQRSAYSVISRPRGAGVLHWVAINQRSLPIRMPTGATIATTGARSERILLSWKSKKQACVTLSSTEAE